MSAPLFLLILLLSVPLAYAINEYISTRMQKKRINRYNRYEHAIRLAHTLRRLDVVNDNGFREARLYFSIKYGSDVFRGVDYV